MRRISSGAVTFAVLAIVLGLVAAYVVRLSMQEPAVVQPPPPEPPPGTRVVLAAVNLPKHSRLRAEDLQTITIAHDKQAPEGSLKYPQIATGRILKDSIRAGQVIREEMLLGIGETLPGLAERIPPGHRALTITVAGARPGGKKIEEGSYVDIALTVTGDHPDLGEMATRTLLRRVLVVDASADESLRRADRGDNVITVAVASQDANKLINAEQSGTLNVTLCSAEEGGDPVLDDDITRRELLGLREIPVPAEPAPPKVHRVEQWTGSTMKVLELSEAQINEARAATAAGEPIVRPQFGGDVFVSGDGK